MIPCIGAGDTSSEKYGFRLRSVVTMSRSTAPVGEVTTPIRRGRNGSARFRASSKSPSARICSLSFSSWASSAPMPAGSTRVAISCIRPLFSNTETRPVTRTRSPIRSCVFSPRAALPLNSATDSVPLSSLMSK